MKVKGIQVLLPWALAASLFVSMPLYSQDTPDSDTLTEDERRDVFAPFVSRLRVAVRDPQIRLTWRDSTDLEEGTYRVYRHTREITDATFSRAELVSSVESGVETYLDTPLETGEYYYAVVAVDADGRDYPIFVPFRNKTIRSVAVTRLETEEDLAARVYDIAAQAQEDAIVLRFNTSRAGRRLVVYRATVPYDELTSPTEATLLGRIDSSTRRFIDYAVPGVEYYYGILDAALVERGTFEIQPGANVLSESVKIPLRISREDRPIVPSRGTRPAPLPVLELSDAVRDDRRMVARTIPHDGRAQPVRAVTQRSITRLLEDAPRRTPFDPEPVILPQERAGDGQGAARTLSQVLRNHFVEGEYATTAELLQNLLELPLNRDFERRVRFYLGQALWFDERRNHAFMEFLVASEGALYSESRPWISGILEAR